jgi:hypothetical protein
VIAVCELQCKSFSHEKFNSGFLHGLRLAFPQEAIRVYADPTHIESLQKIMAHDNVVVTAIEWVPIEFRTAPGALRALGYRWLLVRILAELVAAGVDKLFMLSFNAEILYTIKKLKQRRAYRNLKFTLVLHGSFETIAAEEAGAALAAAQPELPDVSLLSKLRRTSLAKIPRKVVGVAARAGSRVFAPWRFVSTRLFNEKKILLWQHNDDFHYIALAPHVKRNAALYVDVDKLNFHVIVLPTVFAPVRERPRNAYAKFAMFGYGNAPALHQVLVELAQHEVRAEYEIRVIGMDGRGTEGFAHVTCPSHGRALDRVEMENYAQDIDMFLILYDSSRYRLSCSGTILEAMSYMKPVLHLPNECIDGFDRDEAPIGLRCASLADIAAKIQEIAEQYTAFGPTLDRFRDNLLKLRDACSIESWVHELRRSFTWP